ncbi:cep41 [Symbiodinium natans]|uniref:Cep41 protein n=1 Tax=Symbiodinium natans TaxID=878477 RepID=A0A812KQJ0_9DINO|nr:cep41 [Symbiodinium natans]
MKSSFPSLDKKVPESKKYAHIGSSIDTGASAKKEKLHSANVMAKRKDEIFKRIRAATLVRLLQDREVSESVYALGRSESCLRCGDCGGRRGLDIYIYMVPCPVSVPPPHGIPPPPAPPPPPKP